MRSEARDVALPYVVRSQGLPRRAATGVCDQNASAAPSIAPAAAGTVPTVFVVDDDLPTCDAIAWLLQSTGLPVRCFPTAEAFLAGFQPGQAGCLIVDVRLPGMSGITLQQELRRQDIRLPVIVISGYGEVSTAVQAFQHGAIDFIEKPFDDRALFEGVDRALAIDAERRRREREHDLLLARVEQLTPREREVMAMVVAGKANKVIAIDLGISHKTVECHRASIMDKLGVDSLAELVRLDWQTLQGGLWRAA